MKYFRPQRVGSLIRDKLAEIILKEMEFFGALVTLTSVEVDAKLENAAVYVSVLPSAKAAGVFKILKKFQGRLQHLLVKEIEIKPMPRISFKLDYGPEKAAGVEKALLKEEK